MTWPILFRVCAAVLFVGILAYIALQIRRRKSDRRETNSGVNFQPTIGFSRLDGWASIALLLVNKSHSAVWAEEIEISLTELNAVDQTCEASCHEIQKIHQTVGQHDVLPISLVETIYNAAGKPQRKYSCLLSSIVRYSVGKDWFEKAMPRHRLKMAGLTVVKDRRERGNKSEVRTLNKPSGTETAESKPKRA